MKSKVSIKPHKHTLTPMQRAASSFSDSDYGQSIGPLKRGPIGPASTPNVGPASEPNIPNPEPNTVY